MFLIQPSWAKSRCAANTPVKPVEWVLPSYLARRKVHILAGPPATAKSTIAYSMAARITRGGDHWSWPNPTLTVAGNVLIISTEDNFDDKIVPLLIAAGADLKRVHHIDGIPELRGGSRPLNFSSDGDEEHLRNTIQAIGGCSLIILDPIGMIVSSNSQNDSKVRQAHERLGKMAERLNVAILGITHVSKMSKGRDPISRVSGCLAVTAVPRGLMITARIENGPNDDGSTHVLVHAKTVAGKVAGGWSYSIAGTEVNAGGVIIPTAKIVWHSELHGTPQDILANVEKTNRLKKPNALDKAIEFLRRALSDGPCLRPELIGAAEMEGIAESTLLKAGQVLGVISTKQKGVGQFSPFEWRLPVSEKKGGAGTDVS